MSERAPQEFEPVKNAEEITRYFREGAKSLASAMLWTKDQQVLLQTNLNVFNAEDQTFYVWLPQTFDPRVLELALSQTGSQECYFSLSLSNANLFFAANYSGFDEGGIRFAVPDRVFKVQRRQDYRYVLAGDYTVPIEFDDPMNPGQKYKTKLLDLSAGGAGILIREEDITGYTAGLSLENLTFNVKGTEVNCRAEVRHVKKIPDDQRNKGFKIGIAFIGLKHPAYQAISSYVFEEARKYYSKFI